MISSSGAREPMTNSYRILFLVLLIRPKTQKGPIAEKEKLGLTAWPTTNQFRIGYVTSSIISSLKFTHIKVQCRLNYRLKKKLLLVYQ